MIDRPATSVVTPDDRSRTAAHRAARRLTKLYVFALSTVAVLSIGAQWLTQRQLASSESDSRVVNVAGRQRMLSQRIAKNALRLASPAEFDRSQAVAELRKSLDEWTANHGRLVSASPELGLSGASSPQIAAHFERLKPHFEAIRGAATRITADAPATSVDDTLAAVQRHEGEFLSGMDAIVSQYVVEAEGRVNRLRALETGLLGLTLAVLLAEGLLVFRPAVRRITETVAEVARVSDRLREARDEAQHANASKSRFLANISHELCTPLTAILGMTELARNETDDALRRERLRVVDEAGEMLLALLNDLIDLSTIDAGELKLAPAPMDPTELVARVARVMAPAAEQKGLALRVQSSLPAGLLVVGDARRIEQVLVNLASNAIKWTDKGSVALRCEAAGQSRRSGDSGGIAALTMRLRFVVEDTGCGVPVDDQQRAFQPFTQLEASGATRGGAGLGLAICRRIADAMGATLDFEQRVEAGTTIALVGDFPVALTHAARPAQFPAPPLSPRRTPLRVLVVEDTEVNRVLLRAYLEQAGHVVAVAASGEDAIAVVSEGLCYDVAVIDLQLPGANGLDVARNLRALASRSNRPLRLVCVSANAVAGESADVRDAFDAFLSKPLRRQSLLDLIDSDSLQERDLSHREALDADAELVAAFVAVAPEQIEGLRSALGKGDYATARVLAHRFAGQVGYFDRGPLLDRLHRLEDACGRADGGVAGSHTARIVADLNTLVERLRAS
ncbi:MAG: ATP-binding protein [Lacipirellulaceae bacterium]